MKLIHLFEEDLSPTPNNVDQLKRFLSTHCQPYLTQFKSCNKPLLRGMKPAIDVFVVTTPINRAPTNTPIAFHIVMDDWFNDKFGHRYRSNAVFCTGSPNQARLYGELYWVFPIGEFTMCWSSQVTDLYNTIKQKFNFMSFPKHMIQDLKPNEEDLRKLLSDYRYKEGKVMTAINSGCEVMVACEKYLCVADSYAKQHNLLDEIKKL